MENLDNDQKQELVISMRCKEFRLPREGEYWDDEERNYLRFLYETGKGLTEIAILLKRTELAVIQQALMMNLFYHPATKRKRVPKPPECKCKDCKCVCMRNGCREPMQGVGQC